MSCDIDKIMDKAYKAWFDMGHYRDAKDWDYTRLLGVDCEELSRLERIAKELEKHSIKLRRTE